MTDLAAASSPLWECTLREKVARGALELPVFPAVAAEIGRAAEHDADARALAAIVRNDGAVSAHLLRLANSPMFRGREPIVTVQQAIARLGREKLRQVAMMVALESRTFRAPGFDDELDALSVHGLAVACFAQAIARTRASNAEDAFLAGLLHDLGRLVLVQAAVDAGGVARAPVLRVVDELHTQAAAALAARWSLPRTVSSAMAAHHGTDASAAPCVHVVRLADALAEVTFGAASEDELRVHPSLGPLDIYPDGLDALLALQDTVKNTVAAVNS